MRAFHCQRCDHLVFFENTECLYCGTPLGFAADRREIVPLEPLRYRSCHNVVVAGCNWLVASDDPVDLCRSCRLTRTRPNDFDAPAVEAFAAAEAAKRRLVFQLYELSLPVVSRLEDPYRGLAFDLLSSYQLPVWTGHENGIVTLDLSESDDSHREQVRLELGEPYRTVLGHLRHEIGHYYWPSLVEEPDHLEGFRVLFGDERASYAEALEEHYRSGLPPVFDDAFVSGYAATHPFEDWAETFAHYLHIRDTLQTAEAFDVRVTGPRRPGPADPGAASAIGETDRGDFRKILDQWLPLSCALNGMNRSMGKADLYPFVLSPAVVEKLQFVHDVVRERAATPAVPRK